MTKKDKSIIKYNKTIQATNGVSFQAHKCFNVLYNHFFQWIRDARRQKQTTIWDMLTNYPNYTPEEIIESGFTDLNIGSMKVLYLMEKLNMKTRDYKYLTATLKELVNTKIEFNILENDGKASWGYYSVLSAVDVKNGNVRYEIPTLLIEKIINSPNYTRINLTIQNRMTNRYALVLYENCQNWFNNQSNVSYSPKLSVEQLRKLIVGDLSKYTKFIEFSRLLRRIIKEINNVSDLNVHIKKFTELRSVKYIQFRIEKQEIKNTPPKAEKNNLSSKGLDKLRNDLKDRGIVK